MKFTTLITQDFHTKPIEQNLRAATNAKILTLQNLKPYKDIRHTIGLPVKGQHANAAKRRIRLWTVFLKLCRTTPIHVNCISWMK